jgi:hypothetical protein
MKDVLLCCLMGVRVDKKIIQLFFCLVIDIYDLFVHMCLVIRNCTLPV